MRILVGLLMLWPLPLLACALDDAAQIELDGGGSLFYRIDGAPRVAQPFALLFQFCRDGTPLRLERFKFDARMPAHGHGMNYRPAIENTGAGRYRVDGLILHMPGAWQLKLDNDVAGAPYRLTIDLKI